MIEGHFVENRGVQLFVTQFGDASENAILFVPSFAEEMNLSRAVVAKQAEKLASRGFAVFMMDYSGTGDSEAEFDEVDAQRWAEDLIAVGRWIHQHGYTTINLWGMRFGSLLIFHNAQRIQSELNVGFELHWKPVTSGKQFVGQFLRIKQAADMAAKGEGGKVNWREKIRQGEFVEVAGYPLCDKLLSSIDEMKIDIASEPSGPFAWIEIGGKSLLPAVQRYQQAWQSDHITFAQVEASAFWQIPEIFDLPLLTDTTCQIVSNLKEA